ncbi:hypothetical protein H6F43_18045 [Leptolyngbya sp. FACHB-36]|uniref:hypothetical protein n=1 Tax=Leptolyngbya sp. FACHB-36 TaxID=2692808 RepID=UPI0016800461|nr:hypothetical protein [Leptolyngbya sp. FACHB-36]MBD2022083.1 hypothetical protein [Leptolyngbya sp. FACHB-36]
MILRKLLIVTMILTLGVTSVACGGPSVSNPSQQTQQGNRPSASPAAQTRLSDGEYPVQQVTYDDGSGAYNVAVLNTKPGQSSTFSAPNIPLARLSDEDVKAGKKSYLKVEQGQPALYLAEDYRIEYVHNVTQTQTNQQTGQQETVVVRQEPSFWTPFAGALAGQALGSLLFRPQYYMPPAYQPGVPLNGFGGYGNTYGQAVSRYQSRYQAPPAEVRNRQTFRSTGQLRSPTYGQPGYRRSPSIGSDRPTGSGYGTSTLRRSPSSPSRTYRSPSGSGFGSGRRSVGGRRR